MIDPTDFSFTAYFGLVHSVERILNRIESGLADPKSKVTLVFLNFSITVIWNDCRYFPNGSEVKKAASVLCLFISKCRKKLTTGEAKPTEGLKDEVLKFQEVLKAHEPQYTIPVVVL